MEDNWYLFCYVWHEGKEPRYPLHRPLCGENFPVQSDLRYRVVQKLNFLRICQWNGFVSLTCPDKCPTPCRSIALLLVSEAKCKEVRAPFESDTREEDPFCIHYCSVDWDNIRRHRIHLLNQTFLVLSAGCHRFSECPRERQQTCLLLYPYHSEGDCQGTVSVCKYDNL